jgi:flagellar hook assembly protein FlgD
MLDQTAFALTVPAAARVDVLVFDAFGRRVRTLLKNKELPAGTHGLGWAGRDESGAPVPAGVYLLRARAGAHQQSQKIAVVR